MRPMYIMLILLAILFGGIFLYKGFQSYMMNRFFASQSQPIVTISAMKAEYQTWQPKLRATGTIRAIKGVNVTTELDGMVRTIYFTPGATVEQYTVLVQLNADAELAQLRALEATAKLAKIVYERDKSQFTVRAVSQATLDTDLQNLKNAEAQVEQQKATVAKKTIRAPFNGRLGISRVNPGQYLKVGDPIVTLQSLDPIYADFYVPQQALTELKIGQQVNLKVDTFRDELFNGMITTINPLINLNTRNVLVEATLPNPDRRLIPGMFATLYADVGETKQFITLPQTAVTYNPYGDIVYLIHESGKDDTNKPILIAKQVFVTTGDTRGDQVAILKGIKAGDMVVTSGQVKLKNGSRVVINNKVVPSNNPNPIVPNERA